MKLITAFDRLFARFSPCFKSVKTFTRARALAFSSVVTLGRHAISRLICAKNEQQQDWSADYKFFSVRAWDAHDLFHEIFRECATHFPWPDDAVLVALDDTTRAKTGKKIPGVMTLRDPMSLPFYVNLKRGIRYLQGSAIIAPDNHLQFNRAVPVFFEEAAPAKKPVRTASAESNARYEQERKTKRISVRGHQAALRLRLMVDQLSQGNQRRLFLAVDGSFCNRCFLTGLPDTITSIVRTRKDLKIFQPAASSHTGKGRKQIYGDRLPTPEAVRTDDAFSWLTASIFAAGKYHHLRYKTIAPVLWKKGTGNKPCRLIVIAPLRYRLSITSRLLYREPAYILVTDTTTPVERLLQFYFLRWGIEINHRDEKSVLGVGDAQVRTPKSVERNPQFAVVVYSVLLLASLHAYGPERTDEYLPLPKWRKPVQRRPSTLDILAQFRREVMAVQLQQNTDRLLATKNKNKSASAIINKSNFLNKNKKQQSVLKLPIDIRAALLYADS